MGMLSGKYDTTHRPQPGDVRLDTPWWDYFDADTMPGWLRRLDTVRQLLTVGGRTLVQGALGYLLALDPSIIPLPGIRRPQAEPPMRRLGKPPWRQGVPLPTSPSPAPRRHRTAADVPPSDRCFCWIQAMGHPPPERGWCALGALLHPSQAREKTKDQVRSLVCQCPRG